MMPFAPAFDIVYETIEAAASEVGLRCVRADTIWEADHVKADVLSILWRSQIVVADLTGKNANVFYETGLAHALPGPRFCSLSGRRCGLGWGFQARPDGVRPPENWYCGALVTRHAIPEDH